MNRKELVRRHLAETLMEMCDEGALLSALTVSDVVARAGIARQTFYNHFDDLDDLIFFTASLPMVLENNPFTDYEATCRLYERSARHKSFFVQLPNQQGEKTFRVLANAWLRRTYREKFVKPTLPAAERAYREACIDVYCFGCNEAFLAWCASGMKAPVEALVRALYDMTPAFAKPERDALPARPKMSA